MRVTVASAVLLLAATAILAKPFSVSAARDEREATTDENSVATLIDTDAFTTEEAAVENGEAGNQASPFAAQKPLVAHSRSERGGTCPTYPQAARVFYNRIPKAGSTSLKTLAMVLGKTNGFTHVSSRDYNDRGWFSETKERENVARINEIFNSRPRLLYDQHIRYLDFEKFNMPPPLFMNMVREPVSRAVSTYYFARTGTHSRIEEIREVLGEQADWSINECIRRREECSFFQDKSTNSPFNLMTRFFCGHDPVCRSTDEAALELAKYNLKNRFIFVGVTERFTESVTLLEKLLPEFFSGAARLESHKIGAKNVNAKAGERPTAENERFMRQLSRYDVELYAYATELFDRMLHDCGIEASVA